MNISVTMCTCNGAPYLAEQLQSIAAQDCLPDELVVCDDCSCDETAAIVRGFAAAAPLEVRLTINDRKLGSRANFAQAIALCRGQWILLADQDDVWMPHKVRRLRQTLAADPQLGLAFSDAAIVDHCRRPLGYGLWEAVGLTRRQQAEVNCGRALGVLLRHDVVTGATMALRAQYRELVLPIPDGWVHDAWIALLISAVARCSAIAEPLMEYRQHAGQQIGQPRPTFYQQYLRGKQKTHREFRLIADNYTAARDRLAQFRAQLRSSHTLEELERKAAHFRAKARMRHQTGWRLPIITRELLHCHYAKYSWGWRSLAQDLFL